MGLDMKRNKTIPANFSIEEVENIRKQFSSIDVDGKGFITLNDLRTFFAVRMKNDMLFSWFTVFDMYFFVQDNGVYYT